MPDIINFLQDKLLFFNRLFSEATGAIRAFLFNNIRQILFFYSTQCIINNRLNYVPSFWRSFNHNLLHCSAQAIEIGDLFIPLCVVIEFIMLRLRCSSIVFNRSKGSDIIPVKFPRGIASNG